jgi:hypothetical protein
VEVTIDPTSGEVTGRKQGALALPAATRLAEDGRSPAAAKD